MRNALRILLLVVLLNVVRYVIAGPLAYPLFTHRLMEVMGRHAEVFAGDFTTLDWASSFLYNFVLWWGATVVFHLSHPVLPGGWVAKSIQAFGLVYLLFAAISFIYMNHQDARLFYVWSVLDGLVAFAVVALANAFLYPRLVPAPRGGSEGAGAAGGGTQAATPPPTEQGPRSPHQTGPRA